MKIFEVQTGLTTYTYSVVKIVISVLIILFCFFRNRFIYLPNTWINILTTVVSAVLVYASVLCLYISIGEMFHTYSNRNKNKCPCSVKSMDMETILGMVSNNDIIEIEVFFDSKTIKIGASADCKFSSSKFENKRFYIMDSEYESLQLFSAELIKIFPSKIPVSRIDGIVPK